MIERYNYEGDTSIGFYATVTEEYAVIPPKFKRSDFFNGETVETYIARTRLVGLYTAGNSNCLLVPDNTSEHEKEKLEESSIEFQVLDTRPNALGNLILANEKGAVISEKIEDRKQEIEEALEVPVTVGEIAGLPNPGVCGAANERGALLHRAAREKEAEKVKEALGVEDVDIGTINLGSPYISSGLLANSENILVGEDTSGPEVGRIDRVMHETE